MNRYNIVWFTTLNINNLSPDIKLFNEREKNIIAPWMDLLFKEYEKRNDKYELYVVASFTTLKKDLYIKKTGSIIF